MPFFRNNMCGDLLLVSHLHLVDNAGQVVFDALFKIRPFITLIMDKVLDVYSLERDFSFDEAICAWKCKLRFRVYNPKPTKFGIKLSDMRSQ